MRSSICHTESVYGFIVVCVREETVGASLGSGGSEVASELWNERTLYFH